MMTISSLAEDLSDGNGPVNWNEYMFAGIGIVVLLVMVFGIFALSGGDLGVVLHALPIEMGIIGGAAVGALIIGNNGAQLKALLGAVGKVFKRSEEHTSELQSRENLVCRLLLEK